MKTKIEVTLKPFAVPNFVTIVTPPVAPPGKREDGLVPTEGIPLSALDSETLDRLCREFRAEVFRKAGKELPPEPECSCNIVPHRG